MNQSEKLREGSRNRQVRLMVEFWPVIFFGLMLLTVMLVARACP